MNKHHLAQRLLKAGMSSALVSIQTGLSPDQVLMLDTRKIRSIQDVGRAKSLPRLEEILGSATKSCEGIALLLLYTSKAGDWTKQIDIDALITAYEAYLRGYFDNAGVDTPSPLSLDEAWILTRELRSTSSGSPSKFIYITN
ncbi:hypothetical protein I6U33_29735 [Pseudomonas carnis]|uniref:hypothetical protein n=1 Tax=Pseudomonas carnis TaxID=2487355 RepID=UPI001C6F84D4|nr:hypothetical protein [Pseudomonas carnis]MBW9241500.1 hypothetical protein [Pseudomonas carnis]